MTIPVGPVLTSAVLAVALAGLLAAAETALSRVSRARAAQLRLDGHRGSQALARVVADPAPTLAVATFVRVLAECTAVAFTTLILHESSPNWWAAAVTAILATTAVSFIVVGVGPRTLGRQHADRIALVAAGTLLGLSRVLRPLTKLLVLVGNLLTPGRGYRDGPFASEAELRELVDLASENQLIEDEEREMIHSVIELGNTITREVMVPRTDLVAIDSQARLPELMSLCLRSGFSRIPVLGQNLDDVLGVAYLKDVARRLHESPSQGVSELVAGITRPVLYIPDSKPVDALLRQMQQEATHVAIVIDEYGGTAGLVTLEDLVEEIVGEISDEYDPEEPETEPLGDGRYRVWSRAPIDEVGELFDLELEDEEVETIGGLLAKALGRVPIAGAGAVIHGLELTAERFEGRRNRLATVIVGLAPEEPETEEQ